MCSIFNFETIKCSLSRFRIRLNITHALQSIQLPWKEYTCSIEVNTFLNLSQPKNTSTFPSGQNAISTYVHFIFYFFFPSPLTPVPVALGLRLVRGGMAKVTGAATDPGVALLIGGGGGAETPVRISAFAFTSRARSLAKVWL